MDQTSVATLSEMQLACLRLVADLKKSEQIAGELGISPSTVNTHIERAIARLGVANRREAARLVMAYAPAATPGTATPPPPPAHDMPPAVHSPRASEITETTTPSFLELRPSATDSRPEKLPTENQRLFESTVAPPSPSAPTIAMGRRRNDLTVSQRLLASLMALVLLCLAIAGLGAAIEQLSDWRSSYAARR